MPTFTVEPGPDFARALLEFEAAHYKRDKQSAAKFLQLVEALVAQLFAGPMIPRSHTEGFPAKSPGPPDWKCFKANFRSPGLSGLPGEGRLVYLVHDAERRIIPVSVYSHKQHVKRLPDGELRSLFERAIGPEA